MFVVVMMCVTYSSTIFSLIIFNFPLVFKILLLFVEIYIYKFLLWNLFINSNKKSDILKMKETMKIFREPLEFWIPCNSF